MADNAVEIAVRLKNETEKGLTAIRGGLTSISDTASKAAGAIFNFQNALALAGATAGIVIITEDLRKAEQAAIQAAQGSSEALLKLQETSREVWLRGFGENAQEAAQMVSLAFKEMGNASQEELSKAAIAGKQLESAFGADYQKTIQSIGVLMREFGLTAQEATDYVTAGFQRNLDASGDFLDSLLEYAPQFESTKKGAESLFSAMETGAQKGVLGVDKAADAVKEFRVRILSGDKAVGESLEMLGLSYDKITEGFNNGSLTVEDAFVKIQQAVRDSNEPVTAFRAAVGLVGSQFEDLGAKGFASLDLTKTSLADLAGSTEKLNQDYVGLTASITKLSREIIDAFSGELLSGSNAIEDQINEIIKVVQELKESGKLDEWAALAINAFKELAEDTKALIKFTIDFLAAVEPLGQYLLKMSPTIIELGLGFVALGKATDGVVGSYNLLAKALTAEAFDTSLTWAKILTKDMETLDAATTAVQSSMIKLGSAISGLFIGWQIGSVLNEFEGVRKAAQGVFGTLDLLLSAGKVSILEYIRAWKEFRKQAEAVEELNKQIAAEKERQAIIKQTIIDIQNESIANEKKAAIAAKAREAEKKAAAEKAAETQKQAELEKAVINDVTKLKQAEAAFAQKIAADKLKSIKDNLSAYQDSLSQEKQALEIHLKEIDLLEAQDKISEKESIKQKIALQEDFYKTQYDKALANFENVKTIYSADTDTYKTALDLKQQAYADYVDIQKDKAEEVLKIEKEKDEKIAALREVNLAKEKNIRDENLKTIQASLDSEFISFETAFEQKKQAELSFLQLRIDYSEAALQKVIADYGIDSAEYVKALAEKDIATKEFSDKFKEKISEPTPVNIDTTQAEENTTRLTEYLDGMVVSVSEPISINLDISPAQAALQQLASDYQQTAVQAYKSLEIAKNESTLATGMMATLAEKNKQYLTDQYNDALSKYEEYKSKITTGEEEISNKQVERYQHSIDKINEEAMAQEAAYQQALTAQDQLLLSQLEKVRGNEEAIKSLKAGSAIEKEAIERDHILKLEEIAGRSLEIAKKQYGEDSAEYQTALDEKTSLHSEYIQSLLALEEEKQQFIIDAAQQEIEIERQKQAEIKALQDAEYQLAKAQADAQISAIQYQADMGVMAELDAFNQKKAIEESLLEIRIKSADLALENAIKDYGIDTAEYKKAMAEKINLTTEMNELLRTQPEILEKTNTSLVESGQNFQSTIDGIKTSLNDIDVTIPIQADAGQGPGSFSDVLANVRTQLADVTNAAKLNVGGIANINPSSLIPKPIEGMNDPSADPFKIKDLGKLDLNIGGKGIPVMAGKEAYLALRNEIRRREWLTSQGR